MSPALRLAQSRYRYKVKSRHLVRKAFEHIVKPPSGIRLEEIAHELILAESVFSKALEVE